MSLSRPPSNRLPPQNLPRHPTQNNNPNISIHHSNREGGREPPPPPFSRHPTQNNNPHISRHQTNRGGVIEPPPPNPSPPPPVLNNGVMKPISRKVTSNDYFRKTTNKVVGFTTIKEVKEENLNMTTEGRQKMMQAFTAGNVQGENQLVSQEEVKDENVEIQLKSFYAGFGKEKLKVENVLNKEDLEKSNFLKDVFITESPKNKVKMIKSKVFNKFNDFLDDEHEGNLEANPELQNFILNRQYKKDDMPSILGQNQIYTSQYISGGANSGKPTNYKNDVLGLTTNLKSLNNEDVKKYLTGLDNYLSRENIGRIKEEVQDKNKQEKQGEFKKTPSSKRFEKSRSSLINKDLKGGFNDNEELIELRSYYFNEDEVPFWKNSECLNEKFKIGEKLCSQCEEFIDAQNSFDHYGECQMNIENEPLRRINNKIEKMKNLIIYNYKTLQKTDFIKTTDQELVELMNMGIPIINHIIFNRARPKLEELIEDLNKLINNLPTLRNKNSAVFLVLLTKVLQLSNIKGRTIEERFLKKKENEKQKPIHFEIPKKPNQENRIFSEEEEKFDNHHVEPGCNCCGGRREEMRISEKIRLSRINESILYKTKKNLFFNVINVCHFFSFLVYILK